MPRLVPHSLVFICSINFVLAVFIPDILQVKNPPFSEVGTNGKYLRLLTMRLPPFLNTTRNSTGDITEIRGIAVPVLEWLSRTLNFKYFIMSDSIYSVEDNPTGKGTMSYLIEGVMINKKADMILSGVIMTASRYRNINYPYPFVFDSYGFIVPMPRAQSSVVAVWKPFQSEVWIGLSISLLVTTVSLYGIGRGISAIYTKNDSKDQNGLARYGEMFEDVIQAWQYVFGVILSQGMMAQKETSQNQTLTIRLLAATWCLACFVLITAFSSVLISFVTLPYYKPLIDSIYDIPKNPQIKITVDRGLPMDSLFTNAKEGIYKYLGDQLRSDPSLRCSTAEQCLDKVRNGLAVYTIGYLNLITFMGADLKRTGRCDFTIIKERFYTFSAGLALSKQFDVEPYNRGMLKAHEGGFINLWYDRNVPDASQCLSALRNPADTNIRLTVGGLSGAFVLLAFGYSLSLFILVCEIIFKICFNA